MGWGAVDVVFARTVLLFRVPERSLLEETMPQEGSV